MPNPSFFFEHIQNFDEIVICEVAIRPCIDNDFVGLINVKFIDDDKANHELSHDIEAIFWKIKTIHVTGLNGCLQRSQFNQIIDA